MERENKAAVLGWFIFGAVLGAGAALLIAPERGTHTRRRLLDQAERGRKTLLESGQELFEKGRELYERGREIAEDAADMFERGRQIAEKTIDERI
ncbi:MAG: YtxH domain-containing protein [Acidobacteriaceae bacterium]|nr:YtxH domain-containing protein [Acidobacteriaceae bacterium]